MNTRNRADLERIAQSPTPFFLTVEDAVYAEANAHHGVREAYPTPGEILGTFMTLAEGEVERRAMTHGNSLKTEDAREVLERF